MDDEDDFFKQSGYPLIEEDEPAVLRIYAGAYINENFSVELDYLKFDDFEAKDDQGNTLKDEVAIFSFAAVAHYPVLDDRIDWFAKFGAGQVKGDDGRSYDASALIFGSGVGYRPVEYLTFKIGYDRYDYYKKDAEKENSYDMILEIYYAAFEVQF